VCVVTVCVVCVSVFGVCLHVWLCVCVCVCCVCVNVCEVPMNGWYYALRSSAANSTYDDVC
jgi:hypothetical protein